MTRTTKPFGSTENRRYSAGGDQAVIARIANEVFGGYRELFFAHGWEWPGSKAMNRAATLLKKRYGSIAAFEDKYDFDLHHSPFSRDPEVWITSFWGWAPETWGCVGFTQEGRRKTFLEKTAFPCLMVIYVTEKAPDAPKSERGRVLGFYEVFDLPGDRDVFTADEYHSHYPEKWRYSLKALRAFEILPEFRPHIRQFDPSIRLEGRELPVSKHGALLRDDAIERLKALPRREVAVFGVNRAIEPDIIVSTDQSPRVARSGYVRGGPGRRVGYDVGEPQETEKELYVLKLSGDPEIYLGRACEEQSIYKVGLSLSPKTRVKAFNNAMPKGAFKWELFKSTFQDDGCRYSTFEIAEKGEMAMKRSLGQNQDNHLGGEFYLASDSEIEEAWKEGRATARDLEKKTSK